MIFPPTLPQLAAIGSVILALILVLFVGLDLYYELTGEVPLEERLSKWGGRFPLLAGGLVAVAGAVIAHFFWQSSP